ncbi:hypothetical protein HK102_003624 [Quaeritorhiza haematococci]|nr:hypothetical protein HK102_003624 [Quaeritorhiza haematococci]
MEILLAKDPPLQWLGLEGGLSIGDQAVSMIANSRKLSHTLTDLNLGSCNVGDVSVIELANLENLKRLNLAMTQSNRRVDGGCLKGLKKLQGINLSLTRITVTATASLFS